MGLIINANSMEEYNQHINYYQMNGFKINDNSIGNNQTRLVKNNYGPIILHILLIISLLGSITFLTSLSVECLSITNLIIPLNLFSLLLAIKYLQEIGIMLVILVIILSIIILYYYFTKPYEVLVTLNQNNNNRGNLNG